MWFPCHFTRDNSVQNNLEDRIEPNNKFTNVREDYFMKVESNLKYSKDHEWVKVGENKAYIGITDFAQNALGDIVFVELPHIGLELEAQDILGVVESVKAASDIYTPVSGTVVEINEELDDNPAIINEKPYGAWIALLELKDAAQLADLMDEDAYKNYCLEEE